MFLFLPNICTPVMLLTCTDNRKTIQKAIPEAKVVNLLSLVHTVFLIRNSVDLFPVGLGMYIPRLRVSSI